MGRQIHGIRIKKKYGQHFLRDDNVINNIIQGVSLDNTTSVFEVGCGDGVLTKAILHQDIARLWVFEIDFQWVEFVREKFKDDERLEVFEENILDVDFSRFEQHQPWTLLANLPYMITFPILHLLQKNRQYLKEGVIMVQEEVAQKITKTSGRGYGYSSLFFQRYFDWRKLDKIPPTAFFPSPKVHSRLLYFKPRMEVEHIEREEDFWKFIKVCFRQPRRTLRNNLSQGHYETDQLPEELLALRAQQVRMTDLIKIWHELII